MRNALQIDFDSRNDVLYIGFGNRRRSYDDEDDNGIITLKNMDSDIITGVTILDFKKKLLNKSLYNLLKNFPFDIDNDIIPYVKL
ncbi:MAG: hypothetical protein A2Y17_12045 [Clostridiales bacterium GWF2_38_85]|nr:MAG: hypothetical protein A2Y17_12045 [Clostridiales bacterium GWF2_38_85]